MDDALSELLRASDVLIREMNIVLLRLDSRMTEEERQRVHRAFLARVDAKIAYKERNPDTTRHDSWPQPIEGQTKELGY